MKKIVLSAIFLATTVSMTGVQAASKPTFSQQLLEQKTQLRPQEFNFFSDRYKQVFEKANTGSTVLSFSEQLQQQKTQLRPQEFNFYSDRYKQVTANTNEVEVIVAKVQLSFKDQLLAQKSQLRTQEFNFYSDRYKQVKSQVK
jgi:hypothetical protein